MFPYRDENQTIRTPYVTFALIAANVLVWLVIQGAGAAVPLARSVCNLGLIAGELTGMAPPGAQFPMGPDLVCLTDPGPQFEHLLTSMFMHGGWMHLLGNMWFLWIFGNNIEDSMGAGRYLPFYLLCGLLAALAQVAANPASAIPMVGASGAISGVMGAYLVLFPKVRVFTMVPLGVVLTSVAMPAWSMLLFWAGIQFVSGMFDIFGGGGAGGGVAFWAHLGGFVAGAVLIKLFVRRDYLAEHRAHRWQPKRVGLSRPLGPPR